ncbi:bifunctional histidinol-phosphatase/imidazoleglycerol-phosphate dehydratase HisB [Pontibacter sp. BT310]|uniref:Histidine biosynthesis bifunctional protein HisB n=1 Tax=Pontibacter populi TaxID=890055 RepID=A0ABS6XA22_9BACT|nr:MULTISPECIES: bifunctional histidinol-phosphatase/imidazoleglycerol-phosphate dehydratase HisB [Pontibacter]MBJ6117904.1 bifunctional histidinol-phosphatase/imidazoleglycerol-phosphate dehydratase HisB [Pontibacter sp. BT310]MBR0570331.1 bifunctional histidinol-phosphatase/imidazoleglycerol-phosphate dehydratase HisB [Microvirga sp. STS03]MBW3364757.1 bifunctional histidinol-phosphatase/imidazoleglycerol-phosphate dehydratase HisB [Pontibacter populi]
MKKALFIDRDGTILVEPKTDYQVDSFEKFEFIPKVIRNLCKIFTELDYEFVMVTNQDGLGTDSYPEHTFWPYQNKMLEILRSEGVEFEDILIDRSFEHEGLETRKPGIGMMKNYLSGEYDLENSYVIGDRLTDVQLAKNLGAKAILLADFQSEEAALSTNDWDEIYRFLKLPARKATIRRQTSETDIQIDLNLDGTGKSDIKTGLGFFDHMLEQLARHGNVDLTIAVKGDLHIDEHHTIEDTGLALGEAFLVALGDKKGISRYGFLLPMDDVLAQVAIDFGGRPWIVWDAEFKREKVGDMPTEMFFHFFKSFSDAAKCNLNIKAEGQNEHHKIEAIFKGFARAIRMAVKRDPNDSSLPSTKGVL